MSTNSTGDELMNAKLNAGIIETSDVVESEQNTSIPVATSYARLCSRTWVSIYIPRPVSGHIKFAEIVFKLL